MIAVVGELVIDAHRDGDCLCGFPGGAPVNNALVLGRLGVPACCIGAVSNDLPGRRLERALRAAHVGSRRFAAAVVDTLGAGDAFGPGLVAWPGQSRRQDERALRHLGEHALDAALAYAAAQGARAAAWGPSTADIGGPVGPAGTPRGELSREENEWLRSSSTA